MNMQDKKKCISLFKCSWDVTSNKENIKWIKSLAPSTDCNQPWIAGMFNALGFFMQIKKESSVNRAIRARNTTKLRWTIQGFQVRRYLPHRYCIKNILRIRLFPAKKACKLCLQDVLAKSEAFLDQQQPVPEIKKFEYVTYTLQSTNKLEMMVRTRVTWASHLRETIVICRTKL
jgi:hypothetical protein